MMSDKDENKYRVGLRKIHIIALIQAILIVLYTNNYINIYCVFLPILLIAGGPALLASVIRIIASIQIIKKVLNKQAINKRGLIIGTLMLTQLFLIIISIFSNIPNKLFLSTCILLMFFIYDFCSSAFACISYTVLLIISDILIIFKIKLGFKIKDILNKLTED